MALKTKLPPAIYIDTQDAFASFIETLADEAQIAVDTESNNMYAYHGQVCLIQLSTRGQDYIIDPLAIDDIQALGDIFADNAIEKIFHAAEYDLICMKRDFNFEVKNLFDTMAASRLVGIQQFGLGDLLLQYFGVAVDKSHQRDNWGKRPLPKDSLTYAQMDTHYLHKLRDNLYHSLTELNRLEEAKEVFDDVLQFEIKERTFDPDGFWKLGRPRKLNRRQMALLKELYIVREDLAMEEDQPPFKILSNKALVNIAKDQPLDFRSLHNVHGVSYSEVQRYGDDIIDAVQRGRSASIPKQPPREEPDPILAERYIALHSWRKECAMERGLDSSLILAKNTLWNLAREMPETLEELAEVGGFGEWRIQEYGESILDVIAKLK